MEDIIVLKFGGSSVSNNENLKIVANKIIDFKANTKNVVVILSAQGKTTDKLIHEAYELTDEVNKRELDALVSCGEQMSAAKLSILLNSLDFPSVSLTGWQAGIYTNNTNQDAFIENINTERIYAELKRDKIVIITGFQGINENLDITTFGRGGSDTTAVAVAAALKAKNCYIFSDVDGIYSSDPKKVQNTKKLAKISYDEMLELSNEGAKVLHNRCVEIGEKYKIPIITKSTFNENYGTVISDEKIEKDEIKSIIKKDISRISIIGNGMIRNTEAITKTINFMKENKLELLEFQVTESKISITFKTFVTDKMLEKLHDTIFYNK